MGEIDAMQMQAHLGAQTAVSQPSITPKKIERYGQETDPDAAIVCRGFDAMERLLREQQPGGPGNV